MRVRIDEVIRREPSAKILSVASGHLREAEESIPLKGEFSGKFLALDQDEESLKVVNSNVAHLGVTPVCHSVREILTGKLVFSDLDFVYSAGLFDYLADATAKRLLSQLFGMLRAGGTVLVANFHPELEDIAGMETIMGWWLKYRSEEEMALLVEEIPASAIATSKLFRDEHRNIVFLELTKR